MRTFWATAIICQGRESPRSLWAEAETLLARMYAASFAREVPVFSDDALIACHFIGCPIHGEGAE